MGRSFETSTVPNLQFPNYDSACERSYCCISRFLRHLKVSFFPHDPTFHLVNIYISKLRGKVILYTLSHELLVLLVKLYAQHTGCVNFIFSQKSIFSLSAFFATRDSICYCYENIKLQKHNSQIRSALTNLLIFETMLRALMCEFLSNNIDLCYCFVPLNWKS